ncbi:MAG: hypothetical protein LC663_03105 [Actinobacteria bacterium]|nr:hypothetical protein [Actinomycetota bacterium]
MEAHGASNMLAGRGYVEKDLVQPDVAAVYLDAGGHDAYAGPGGDGEVWLTGADVNLT